jgi:hypothetical protein
LVTIGILFALKVSLHHLYLSGQAEWPASLCNQYVYTILWPSMDIPSHFREPALRVIAEGLRNTLDISIYL